MIFGATVLYPEWLTRDSLSHLLTQMGSMALFIYVLISLTRSMLLMPATPFILAGAISFPQWPFLVFAISLVGVVVGAFLVYSFPSFGSHDRMLEGKYPGKISNLKIRMQHKNAFWFVVAWSFFPFVPTDLVCYVAGIAKMPLRKMLAAILLGELPIVGAYVFLYSGISEWLGI